MSTQTTSDSENRPYTPHRANAAYSYLRRLAFAVLLLIAALAGLNYYADPYGVWHHGLPGDPIKSRPAIRNQERMHKAHAVRLADADCLILGNSRVIVGLDPNHPALPEKTYNFGISASNIYECWRYLQHAAALKKPKMVLLAIDKGMFDAASTPEVDFDEKRLAVTADGKPNPHWRWADIPETLLSLDALVDSLKTIRDKTGVKYKDGMRDEVLMKPYTVPAKILAENERWKDGSRKFLWDDKKGGNVQRTAFVQILEFCAVQKIDLRIFTNPLHGEMLDIEYATGADFAKWHAWLSGTLSHSQAQFHNFYHFLPENSEPFPSPTDKASAMQSYWEISHYRKAVGDRVISEVMKNDPQPQRDWLETLKAEREKWKAGK